MVVNDRKCKKVSGKQVLKKAWKFKLEKTIFSSPEKNVTGKKVPCFRFLGLFLETKVTK